MRRATQPAKPVISICDLRKDLTADIFTELLKSFQDRREEGARMEGQHKQAHPSKL